MIVGVLIPNSSSSHRAGYDKVASLESDSLSFQIVCYEAELKLISEVKLHNIVATF
jgi:hypothetical protein